MGEITIRQPQDHDTDTWEADRPIMAVGDVLTTEAITELRTAIRKEKRERRETVESWLKIIGGFIGVVTGLVGALIGLVSVWKHK